MDASFNAQSGYGGYAASNYGADTTLGGGAGFGGSYVGSQVGHAGPPTVNVQDQQGYQEFVVRVPAPEVSQYIQGPPQYRTQVIPGQVMERVVQEVIPGPKQTVQEVIPGPITYRDEKVEIPGPVVERIEKVEVPGPVYEVIEKEFIPGAEVVKEVEVQVPGPVVEKIVKVDVPGPVIRRSVPGKQIEVPGPVKIVPRPVAVQREVIREVVVPKAVVQQIPYPVLLPGPTRHILVKRYNKEMMAANNALKTELFNLMRTRAPAVNTPGQLKVELLATNQNYSAGVPVPIQQFQTQQYDFAAAQPAQAYTQAYAQPTQAYAQPTQAYGGYAQTGYGAAAYGQPSAYGGASYGQPAYGSYQM